MELEELKNIWQSDKQTVRFNEAELASMLNGSSRSLVDKLKKSVWFELTFTLVAGLAFLAYALMLPSGALKWVTISILVLFVAYAIYYVKKILLLNRFNSADNNLKTNLEKLVLSLNSYLKFYKRSYTVLYPVYFGLGIIFGAMQTGPDVFFKRTQDPYWLSLLLGIAILFYILSTLFTNWFFKKLYGNHIAKLEALLQELKGEDREVS
jgi:hypothetical protein